ncbi:MBL fold metallo-hydrolase [Ilyomonas limi]|uniref:MBL fold metallo-hydrolase n=1 Tax=Ilyomonas limi TaxID=2575867 RepID=A0A4U3KQA7_9BACT|nr:MBL fold metallo-hydrolase [Ilyomonas limi]TKK64321.1 MBL fold metallo-hydrolase [Ilyomonas limi]
MKLYTINTGFFKLDGGAMFGVVPKTIWNKLNPADDNNLCTWAMRCLLIEDEERLILVDTGIGNKQSEKFFSHYYLHGDDTLKKSLAAHGFSKEDITDVFLTHLHFDHCGGAIERVGDKLLPAFKNATYWSNKKHWQWATEPNAREKASFLKDNFLPIQESGQLKFIQEPEQSENKREGWSSYGLLRTLGSYFNNNIFIRFANGHTEAMMLPVINYNGKTIVYMADLLPSTAHIPLPYVMAYDMFPLTTLQEKEGFLNEALRNNYVLYFEHDPHIECCTLEQTEKGIRVKNTFQLSEIS